MQWKMAVVIILALTTWVVGCRPTGSQTAVTAVPTRVVGVAGPATATAALPATGSPTTAPMTATPPAAATAAASPTTAPTMPQPTVVAGTTGAGGGGGGATGAPSNTVAAGLGAATPLRVGQALWVTDAGVQVEVLDLLDSRCPQGTTCVRAGEVKVTVRVSEGGRELGTVTVASAPKDAQSKAVGGYTVTLLDVQPPKTRQETPKGEYVLTLRVARG